MSDSEPVVLIIEDEPQIRRFLRATLASHGYALIEATTAQDGLAQAATRQPDLVILDLGLPDLDGLEVAKQLREWSRVPIIVLSARGQENDKIAALDAGADDYLPKPFGVGELMARMRVALRHIAAAAQELDNAIFLVDDLRVDLARRQVFIDDEQIHLTPLEYRFLPTLLRYAGKVIPHLQLLQAVWGPAYQERSP